MMPGCLEFSGLALKNDSQPGIIFLHLELTRIMQIVAILSLCFVEFLCKLEFLVPDCKGDYSFCMFFCPHLFVKTFSVHICLWFGFCDSFQICSLILIILINLYNEHPRKPLYLGISEVYRGIHKFSVLCSPRQS